MGVTGLLLCGFLVAHLAGNFLLYVGPDAYNEYADTLHKQKLLLAIAELGLLVLFLMHIYLAISTGKDNKTARSQTYDRKQTKIESNSQGIFKAWPENWMFVSGALVLGFIILHLIDFRMEFRPDITYEGKEPFEKAVMLLKNPITATVYFAGTLLLGVHLTHGVASAFQSLGTSNQWTQKCFKWFSIIFGVGISLGFASFPVWALFK